MATLNSLYSTSNSQRTQSAVVQALDMLDMDGKGWTYVIDVLVSYTVRLTHFKEQLGADEARDHVQDAICDFLSGRRTWTYYQECFFDSPVLLRNAFITFLKFVIKSIVRNKYRRAALICNESMMRGHSDQVSVIDSFEDYRDSCNVSMMQRRDHLLHAFKDDEMATFVLSTIIDMSLYTNAEIACELQVNASVVRNAKRRIARRYN